VNYISDIFKVYLGMNNNNFGICEASDVPIEMVENAFQNDEFK